MSPPSQARSQGVIEAPMQVLGRGGHVLEVAERPAGFEQLEDLGVKRALSPVLEVMDRER